MLDSHSKTNLPKESENINHNSVENQPQSQMDNAADDDGWTGTDADYIEDDLSQEEEEALYQHAKAIYESHERTWTQAEIDQKYGLGDHIQQPSR